MVTGKGAGKAASLTLRYFFWSIPARGDSWVGRTERFSSGLLVLLVVEPLVNCVGQKKNK